MWEFVFDHVSPSTLVFPFQLSFNYWTTKAVSYIAKTSLKNKKNYLKVLITQNYSGATVRILHDTSMNSIFCFWQDQQLDASTSVSTTSIRVHRPAIWHYALCSFSS